MATDVAYTNPSQLVASNQEMQVTAEPLLYSLAG